MPRWRHASAWLGWALAAVLLVGVGGSALASNHGGPATPVASGVVSESGPTIQGAHLCGRFPRACVAARRAPVRGELTVPVPDKPGTFEQIVFARGEVTAISASSISIRSADGQVTAFTLDSGTRYRRGRDQIDRGDVTVGSRALVSGPREGRSIKARRVHVAKDRPAPTTTTTAPTTTT